MLPINKKTVGRDGIMSDRLRSYDVARKTFSFLEFVGWSVVVVGIIAGFVLAESAGRYASEGQKVLLFLMGASGSLLGLFMVGAVQNWRAGVDSAEYSQQALKVAREQLEISKQSLKRQQTNSASFAAVASSTEQQPTTSFERKEPSVTPSPITTEPGEHRGHKIIRVGGSYRAVGDVFASHDEAMAAIDRKLDSPAIETKQEMPFSLLIGPEPTTARETQPLPIEQPSADEGLTASRSYAEADTSEKSNGPGVAAGTNQDLVEVDTAGDMPEASPAIRTDPATTAPEDASATKIKEEGGKFLYGRMEFSSRDAAEKYVRQLGVNPNFRS